MTVIPSMDMETKINKQGDKEKLPLTHCNKDDVSNEDAFGNVLRDVEGYCDTVTQLLAAAPFAIYLVYITISSAGNKLWYS